MSNQNTKDCCGNTIYNATAEASGIALTYGNNIVTSNANATASSKVSYNDAENIAQEIASNVAQSVAENNANIITETIEIIKKEPIDEGYGNILVTTQSNDPLNIQQNSGLSIPNDTDILIRRNLIPDLTNIHTLGSPDFLFKGIYMGP